MISRTRYWRIGTTVGRGWAIQGGWSLLDQAFFSAANFAVSLLLARNVSAKEYGTFNISQALFLLVATFHTALISEPMIALGAGRLRSVADEYLRTIGVLHRRYCAVGSACFLTGSAVYLWIDGTLSGALAAYGLSLGLLLGLWLRRRVAYMQFTPKQAAILSSRYMIILAAIAVSLWIAGLVKTWTIILALGLAAVGAVASSRGSQTSLPTRGGKVLPELVKEQWSYGKWMASAALLTWLPAYSYHFFLAGSEAGLSATAEYQAAMNAVLPIQQVIAALSGMIVPVLVRAIGRGQLRSRMAAFGVILGGIASLYWAALVAFRVPLLSLLYADRYRDAADLVVILGAVPLLTVGSVVLGAALRALERPRLLAAAYIVPTAMTISIGAVAAARFGAQGAAIAQVASMCGLLVTLSVLLVREVRKMPTNAGGSELA